MTVVGRTVSRTARAALVLVAAVTAAAADSPDCLPDRVVELTPGGANPAQLFGAAFLPGVLLGPPGNSVIYQGSVSVASLGNGGRVTLAFDDVVIEDRPGPDFIVFENAFIQLPLPESAGDPYQAFVEPAFVEVSADGERWFGFPHDAAALAAASGVIQVDGSLLPQLVGLAGITATLTGNWTVPDDPHAFDADGTAGVRGAGGDAFDLAAVGLAEARYVRITDARSGNGFAGASEGVDLDAVVALHARPVSPIGQAVDSDGDGLSDAAEHAIHGTAADDPDTDGDGADDGREVAGCRDPLSDSDEAVPPREPRLWLRGTACTEARWTFLGTGTAYALLRGELTAPGTRRADVDLGLVTCLATETTSLRWGCDSAVPAEGEGFFYLARRVGAGDWGRSSDLRRRTAATDCGAAR